MRTAFPVRWKNCGSAASWTGRAPRVYDFTHDLLRDVA